MARGRGKDKGLDSNLSIRQHVDEATFPHIASPYERCFRAR